MDEGEHLLGIVGQVERLAAERSLEEVPRSDITMMPKATSPLPEAPPEPRWRNHLEDEVRYSGATGTSWIPGTAMWYDNLFLMWWSTHLPPEAGQVAYELVPTAKWDDVLGLGANVEADDITVSLVGSRGFHASKARSVIECEEIPFGLALFAEHNYDRVRAHRPLVSAFGLPGVRWWPARVTVHTLLQTSDEWVIFSLRDPDVVDWEGDRWSVSFEEGVTLRPTTDRDPERTVLDTVLNGIEDEFGPDLRRTVGDMGIAARVCGLGRAFSASPNTAMGGEAIVVARLGATLQDVWRSLSGYHRDKNEHYGWMGCRFASASVVDELLLATDPFSTTGVGPSIEDQYGGITVDVFDGSRGDRDGETGAWRAKGFGWHSTSRARLVLWSRLAFPD